MFDPSENSSIYQGVEETILIGAIAKIQAWHERSVKSNKTISLTTLFIQGMHVFNGSSLLQHNLKCVGWHKS